MNGTHSVVCAPGVEMGDGLPLVVIAGPCALEAEDISRKIAETMKSITQRLGLPYIFKASFDKANRTSISASRGPGLEEGLRLLAKIKNESGVPVLTDIHEPAQAAMVAEVVDVLQIPAFLCRQTDLLVAAGGTGLPVSIKKGQFLAPEDMRPAVEKVASSGNEKIILTERGSSFGYHNLVVDMRSLNIMASIGCPVVFDATHSVQLPGGLGTRSGGQREFVPLLARAAAAVGIHGLFLEVHPKPEEALSDGSNCLELGMVEKLLREVREIHELGR